MSKSKKVYTGAERKAQMLEAGAKVAAKVGVINTTRKMVADACKCAEGLVSVYMGDSATAQKAYARKAKAMGLKLPDKATAEAIGVKLRSHGPRDKRDTRKRSPQEKAAIKRKRAPAKVAKRATPTKVKPGTGTYTGKSPTVARNHRAAGGAVAKPATRKPRPGTAAARGAIQLERERKPATPRERKPKAAPALPMPSPAAPSRKAPENKSAARKPKNPPSTMPDNAPLI